MILEVKQFDEFVNRFNYKTDFLGKKIQGDFQKKVSRSQYVAMLFNIEDERIQNIEKDTNDYLKLINDFVLNVCDSNNSKFISKQNNTIYSIATVQAIYNSEKQDVQLLYLYNYHNEAYAWKLIGIHAGFEVIVENDIKLAPNSNELNFLNLNKSLSELQIKAENGNTFLYFYQNDNLQLKHTKEIKYVVFDLKGWILEVSHFSRNTNNSGWLMSNIIKTDATPKKYFMEDFSKIFE